MPTRSSYILPLAGACIAAVLFLLWLAERDRVRPSTVPTPPVVSGRPTVASGTAATARPTAPGNQPNLADRSILKYLQQMLDRPGARSHEAILTFANAEAFRKFLARAKPSGLTILAQLDALQTVRVSYDSLTDLQADMLGNAADFSEIGANFFINIPQTPAKEDRAAVNLVPLGDKLRLFLGMTGDYSQWGSGVTIAVLDSGVAPDNTFGRGRVQYLDVGLGTAAGTGPEDGHGTAVAALAAGMSPDAPGVAPAASILSIRVTDANAQSDVFTLSGAIIAAVDAGVQIINISLGGYETDTLLANAISYASQRGVVIVASAGNDQAAQLTWPAADPRVVSVGAVDALEQQAPFSNAGAQLQITAPGYGVQTAWLNGQRVYFDGTSASAPIVAGAIAAIMSTSPGMNATQAWQVLQQYASDGGAPGPDADYGNGVLNLGWAMARNDPTRIDTAIASNFYDSATGQMEFVVQNRSGQSVSGLVLDIDAGGSTTNYSIPRLAPGGISVVKLPVDQNQLAASGSIVFRTQLINPPGMVDQFPTNNRRTSSLAPPSK